MARHVDRIVELVVARLKSALPAQLRAAETADGLRRGELQDPCDVLNHNSPGINVSPLLFVYEEGGELEDQNSRLWRHDLTVVLQMVGDAHQSATVRNVRRYLSAVIDTLLADETLGGEIAALIVRPYEAGFVQGDRSETRHLRALGLEILEFSP